MAAKRVILLVISLVLGFCAAYGAEHWFYLHSDERIETSFDSTTLFDEPYEDLEIADAYFAGTTLTATGADPNFYIYNYYFGMTNHLQILLETPAETELELRVDCYEGEAENQTVTTVSASISAGENRADFSLPEAGYSAFRFHFSGNAALSRILSGNMTETVLPMKLHIPRFLGIGAAASALLFLLFSALASFRVFRSFVLCLLILAVFCAGGWCGAWYLSPASLAYIQEGECTDADLSSAVCINCSLADGVYTPLGPDPQFYLSFPAQPVRSVMVRLSSPSAENNNTQIFYYSDTIPLAEQNSVNTLLARGATDTGTNIPLNELANLRIDMDQAASLASVTVSDGEVRLTRKPLPVPSLSLILILCGACLLLACCITLPAFRPFFRALNQKILNPETRWPAVTWLYILFALPLLLHHVYLLQVYPSPPDASGLLGPYWLIFAGLGILLGRMWKDRGFWLITALLLLMYFRIAIPNPSEVYYQSGKLSGAVFAFIGCYSLAHALSSTDRKRFLHVFCALWTLHMAFISCVSIYAGWISQELPNLSGNGSIFFYVGRINVSYHNIVSGVMLLSAMTVALLGASLCQHTWSKTLYLMTVVPSLIAAGLTGTRTGFVLSGFTFALMLCIALHDRLIRRRQRISIPGWMLLGFSVLAITLGLAIVQSYIPLGFNAVRDRGGLLICAARAEAASSGYTFTQHAFTGAPTLDATFSGRIRLWTAALQDLFSSPSVTWLGRSISHPVYETNLILFGRDYYQHFHNIYVQIALETGLPGLCLFLAYLLSFLIYAFRLMRNTGLPLWQRYLPIPALALLASELAECTTHIAYMRPQMILLYLFIGFTVVTGKSLAAKSQAREE